MTTPFRLLALLTITLFVVACSSGTDSKTTPTPEGTSPPIPAAADEALVELSANAIGAPTPNTGSTETLPEDPIEAGAEVSAQNACTACHTIDGTSLVGPTWKGLFGRNEEMTEGPSVKVDDAYLVESIRDPGARIVKGFTNVMPAFDYHSDEEIEALVAYIRSLQ